MHECAPTTCTTIGITEHRSKTAAIERRRWEPSGPPSNRRSRLRNTTLLQCLRRCGPRPRTCLPSAPTPLGQEGIGRNRPELAAGRPAGSSSTPSSPPPVRCPVPRRHLSTFLRPLPAPALCCESIRHPNSLLALGNFRKHSMNAMLRPHSPMRLPSFVSWLAMHLASTQQAYFCDHATCIALRIVLQASRWSNLAALEQVQSTAPCPRTSSESRRQPAAHALPACAQPE